MQRIERLQVTNHERWGKLVKTWATGTNYLEDDNDRDDGLAYCELVHRYLIDLRCQATASSKALEAGQEPGLAAPLSGVELPKGT